MNQPKVKYSLSNWDLVSVNPNYKTWDWKDLFCYWGVNVQSVIGFSLIASLYIMYNLNTFVVLIGTLLGSFFVYLFANFIGKPSQKFGLPFVVLLRSSLGFNGAKFFGLIRSLVGIFLFGIQTYFLSKILTYLIRILLFTIDESLLVQDIFIFYFFGLNIIDWSSILIVIIFQTFLFSIGAQYNKKIINFSAISVYVGIVVFFFLVFLSDVKLTSKAFVNIINTKNFFDINNLLPLLTVAGTVFAYFSILIISFGDISRNVKNTKELGKGNLSLLINLIIFSFFSIFIVAGSDALLNQKFSDIDRIFTNPTDIIGKYDNIQITTLVLFFVVIASASTNLVANYIPSQYSLINFVPNKLSLRSASYIISFLGLLVAIFWLTILSQIGILSFIDTFGAFFGPLFGVIVADYYLINKQSLSNKDLYSVEKESSYYYSRGWHIKGVYSVFLGFIFSASTIWNTNLMFLQSYAWLIGAFVGWITYYLLAKK
ncbi:cytosine permease [Candidatus Pelagibacter sp. HIMB1521]|uniref:cytosine permease n=1 Tax=unclassified Candidatus Pelagibacter TaxID=2647897 RepID=UPI003F8732F6